MTKSHTPPIQDVPTDLLGKIVHRIVQAERRETTRRRMTSALVVFISTGILIVPAWTGFQSDLMKTGFLSYMGLLFSDFHDVTKAWQDFILSLIESFPVLGGVVVLFLGFCFLWSLRYVMTHKIQRIPHVLSAKHHLV